MENVGVLQRIEDSINGYVAEKTEELAKELDIFITPHVYSGLDPLRISLHSYEHRGTRREVSFEGITFIDDTSHLSIEDIKRVYKTISLSGLERAKGPGE